MIEAMGALAIRLEQQHGIRLTIPALGFIPVRWWWVRWEQAADTSSSP
jgi:hypothetical protein